MLRPTNSKTIFLQQLGRGLRKTTNKNKLSVYDLIANIDQKYDITIGIKNLYHNSFLINNKNPLNNDLKGFILPYGCTITLEPKSKEVLLNNLQSWYKTPNRMYKVVKEYYQKYQMKGLERIIADYDMNLALFYQYLNTFYFKVVCCYTTKENQTSRNFNILKQFIFLNNYYIVKYFYLRLKQDDSIEINYHYDNLLIASLFPEVTSMKVFNFIFTNYSDDLVFDFIKNHKLIVQELIMILEYKLNYETLIICHSEIKDFPLLIKSSTYTVRQALVAINRLNFFQQLGPLKIIAFQAGYLTYNQTNSVVFADIDAKNYGKLTKYNSNSQEFYWSIPENKTINSKLVKDLQSPNIIKFLFLNDTINKNYSNLTLKLYNFIGIGSFIETLKNKYITIKFKIKS